MVRWLIRPLLAALMSVPLFAGSGRAGTVLLPVFQDLRGPASTHGAIIWSHGRSVDAEDSLAPTPPYLQVLQNAGWDVFRFNRMRVDDTLPASSRRLAELADGLAHKGYRQVVVAGHSFGAFLSLMAAGQTGSIDGVIATAPAAYGSFADAYSTYRLNATKLWPILGAIRGARVMLFFFHGDDFDPGGRAESARALLDQKGIRNLVIDQPSELSGHSAANSGLFVRRFGDCILNFAEGRPINGSDACDEPWGQAPSPDILSVAVSGGASGTPSTALKPFIGRWYGTYANGREVMLAVRPSADGGVDADYIIGPAPNAPGGASRATRHGHLDNGDLVFDEPGLNILSYRLRSGDRLAGRWGRRDADESMSTILRRVQ